MSCLRILVAVALAALMGPSRAAEVAANSSRSLHGTVGSSKPDYEHYWDKNAFAPYGAIYDIDTDETAPSGLTPQECEDRCTADTSCSCVTQYRTSGKCWMRAGCNPNGWTSANNAGFNVYMKSNVPTPAPEPHWPENGTQPEFFEPIVLVHEQPDTGARIESDFLPLNATLLELEHYLVEAFVELDVDSSGDLDFDEVKNGLFSQQRLLDAVAESDGPINVSTTKLGANDTEVHNFILAATSRSGNHTGTITLEEYKKSLFVLAPTTALTEIVSSLENCVESVTKRDWTPNGCVEPKETKECWQSWNPFNGDFWSCKWKTVVTTVDCYVDKLEEFFTDVSNCAASITDAIAQRVAPSLQQFVSLIPLPHSLDEIPHMLSKLKGNVVETDVSGVGAWGGTCTCPDGNVYQVGDNNDACGSLACMYGVSGDCSSNNPGGAHVRVTCQAHAQALLEQMKTLAWGVWETTLQLPALKQGVEIAKTTGPLLEQTGRGISETASNFGRGVEDLSQGLIDTTHGFTDDIDWCNEEGTFDLQITDCGFFGAVGAIFEHSLWEAQRYFTDAGDKFLACLTKTSLISLPTPFFEAKVARFCTPDHFRKPIRAIVGAYRYFTQVGVNKGEQQTSCQALETGVSLLSGTAGTTGYFDADAWTQMVDVPTSAWDSKVYEVTITRNGESQYTGPVSVLMVSSRASLVTQGPMQPDLSEGDVVRLTDSSCDMARDIRDISSKLAPLLPTSLALNESHTLSLDFCETKDDFKVWLDVGVSAQGSKTLRGRNIFTAVIGVVGGCMNHRPFFDTTFSAFFDRGFLFKVPPSAGFTVQIGFELAEQKRQFLNWGVFAKILGNVALAKYGLNTGFAAGFKVLSDQGGRVKPSLSVPKGVKFVARLDIGQEEEHLLQSKIEEARNAARSPEAATAAALAVAVKHLRGAGIDEKVKAAVPSLQKSLEAVPLVQHEAGNAQEEAMPFPPRLFDFAVGCDVRFCLTCLAGGEDEGLGQNP